MRGITRRVVWAFQNREALCVGNSESTGTKLLLFDNCIAEHRLDGLWITSCGYETATTKERLNGIPGVYIYQKNYQWYLNDEPWDGDWVCVQEKKITSPILEGTRFGELCAS